MNKEEKTNTIETMISIVFAFIIGILIIGITFMILIVNANAENEIQTVALGYNREQTSPVNANTDITIYQSQNTLTNWGRGTLIFTLAIYKNSSNTSFNIGTLREVKVTSNNNIYICNIGTIDTITNENTQFKSNVYSVLCDINLGTNGIQKIDVQTNQTVYNSYYIKTSEYMTFSKNIDITTQAHIDQVNSTLVTYLTSVYNASLQTATNTGATNNYLNAIQILLNTNLNTIVQAINNQSTQAQENHEEIMNYGKDEEPEEAPQEIQDIEQQEENLLEDIEELDLSDEIEIDLDQNSNEWVWNRITEILQTNSKIFGLVISCLVLSVIKTIIGR